MGVCFLCDTKLYGEHTKICSSITPHSMVPYAEKIAELMGEEFVVIVTPDDHMCKKCTTLFTHMDKWECDLKIIKNSIMSSIQKKYGILPPDHVVKSVVIVNGNVKVEEQLEQSQCEVSSGLASGVSPIVTTAAVVTPVQTSFKLLKTQQFRPQQQQPQQQQSQQQLPPTQQKYNNKTKIYKCGFCTYQSKDLGHVRFHMRNIHSNKTKEPEKPIEQAVAAIALTPVPQPKRRLYRCQVCSKSFDMRRECLDHIQKDHNKRPLSTSNGEKENDGSCQITSKFVNLEPFKAQEKNQQADASMDVDENQQDNKGTIDTDMMLNENVPTEGFTDAEQEEIENSDEGVSKNSQEYKTPKVFKSIKKTKPAQEDATEEEEEDKEGAAEEDKDNFAEEEGKEDAIEEDKEDATEEEDKEDATEEDKENAIEEEDKEYATEEEDKEDAAEEEEVENTAVPEQEEADQDSVEKEVEEDCANVENKPGDLDIESMLAAIHNDNAPTNNSVDTQNKA